MRHAKTAPPSEEPSQLVQALKYLVGTLAAIAGLYWLGLLVYDMRFAF